MLSLSIERNTNLNNKIMKTRLFISKTETRAKVIVLKTSRNGGGIGSSEDHRNFWIEDYPDLNERINMVIASNPGAEVIWE